MKLFLIDLKILVYNILNLIYLVYGNSDPIFTYTYEFDSCFYIASNDGNASCLSFTEAYYITEVCVSSSIKAQECINPLDNLNYNIVTQCCKEKNYPTNYASCDLASRYPSDTDNWISINKNKFIREVCINNCLDDAAFLNLEVCLATEIEFTTKTGAEALPSEFTQNNFGCYTLESTDASLIGCHSGDLRSDINIKIDDTAYTNVNFLPSNICVGGASKCDHGSGSAAGSSAESEPNIVKIKCCPFHFRNYYPRPEVYNSKIESTEVKFRYDYTPDYLYVPMIQTGNYVKATIDIQMCPDWSFAVGSNPLIYFTYQNQQGEMYTAADRSNINTAVDLTIDGPTDEKPFYKISYYETIPESTIYSNDIYLTYADLLTTVNFNTTHLCMKKLTASYANSVFWMENSYDFTGTGGPR